MEDSTITLPLKIAIPLCELSGEKDFDVQSSYIELREDSFLYRRHYTSMVLNDDDITWDENETNFRYTSKKASVMSVGFTRRGKKDGPGDIYKITIGTVEAADIVFYLNGRLEAVKIVAALERYFFEMK